MSGLGPSASDGVKFDGRFDSRWLHVMTSLAPKFDAIVCRRKM